MGCEECEQLLAIEEVRKLKARYFRFYDDKDWDAFTDLFTDDAEFTFVAADLAHYPPDYAAFLTPEGDLRLDRDRLLAWLVPTSAYVTTVHHGHMPEITVTAPDRAEAVWRVSDTIRFPSEPPVWLRGHGRYDEEYVRTPDGWRLRRSRYERHELDTIEAADPG